MLPTYLYLRIPIPNKNVYIGTYRKKVPNDVGHWSTEWMEYGYSRVLEG